MKGSGVVAEKRIIIVYIHIFESVVLCALFVVFFSFYFIFSGFSLSFFNSFSIFPLEMEGKLN